MLGWGHNMEGVLLANAGDIRDVGLISATSVFLPGKSRGQRSLMGYSLWDRTELDKNEAI